MPAARKTALTNRTGTGDESRHAALPHRVRKSRRGAVVPMQAMMVHTIRNPKKKVNPRYSLTVMPNAKMLLTVTMAQAMIYEILMVTL